MCQIVLPIRGSIGRQRPLRYGGIHGHLEGPTGWEPGVRQGFSDPDAGALGQDQTGGWQFPISVRRARSDPDQRFYHEVVGWKHMSHPNVVPFLGISETLFPFCIISPWLSGGNILEYIRRYRGVNRLHLVSDHHDIHRQTVRDSVLCSLPKLLVVSNIYIH